METHTKNKLVFAMVICLGLTSLFFAEVTRMPIAHLVLDSVMSIDSVGELSTDDIHALASKLAYSYKVSIVHRLVSVVIVLVGAYGFGINVRRK